MLNIHARDAVGKAVDPLGARLARAGVTANVITVVGTCGVVAAALGFFTIGWWFTGTLVITGFVLLDIVDGAVARAGGTASPFGARAGLHLPTGSPTRRCSARSCWYFARHDQRWLLLAALLCLVLGSLTSYIRARAEAAGLNATVGIAERAERLIIVLVGTGLTGAPFRVPVCPGDRACGCWWRASAITVVQRLVAVYRQSQRRRGLMLADLRGRAVDLGFAAGWAALRTVPEPISARAFRAGADYAAVRNGKGAQQLRRNLRRVLGPDASELRLDRLVGEALRSYSRYWLETFRLPEMDHADVLRRTTMVGAEHLDAALARGRGFVAALPHLGNWDVAALWLVGHGHRFTTVAERLQPQSLFDRFVAYRESLGMEVLALTGGQRPPTEVLAERLARERCGLPGRRPGSVAHRGRGQLLR